MLLPSLPLLLIWAGLTLSHTLQLTLPAHHPFLPASSTAQLTSLHGPSHSTSVTVKNDFVFRNLTSGAYNLDLWCRDWDFEGAVVVVEDTPDLIEVYRRHPTGGRGAKLAVIESDEGKSPKVEVKVRGRREYYEAREGFSLINMLKSPMILMAIAGLGMVFGMPYIMENMDPETRKEFEEQQKKSVLGNAAGGGGPLQSFDMAGWMAGQKSGKSEGEEAEGSGGDRERDKVERASGRSGGGGGGGQGKGRRRG